MDKVKDDIAKTEITLKKLQLQLQQQQKRKDEFTDLLAKHENDVKQNRIDEKEHVSYQSELKQYRKDICNLNQKIIEEQKAAWNEKEENWFDWDLDTFIEWCCYKIYCDCEKRNKYKSGIDSGYKNIRQYKEAIVDKLKKSFFFVRYLNGIISSEELKDRIFDSSIGNNIGHKISSGVKIHACNVLFEAICDLRTRYPLKVSQNVDDMNDDGDGDGVADILKCPITKEIMTTAVISPYDGLTYDQSNLMDYWTKNEIQIPGDNESKFDTKEEIEIAVSLLENNEDIQNLLEMHMDENAKKRRKLNNGGSKQTA